MDTLALTGCCGAAEERVWHCRFVVPATRGVFLVPAPTAEEAAQELLFAKMDLGLRLVPYRHLMRAEQESSVWGPGDSVYFAQIDVEGEGLIARGFRSGIVRRGGLRMSTQEGLEEALSRIAAALSYKDHPSTLLDAWPGESTEWEGGLGVPIKWEEGASA